MEITNITTRIFKCPIHRYTFKVKDIRKYVESSCRGKTLNLFAGPTRLSIEEVTNDLDPNIETDYTLDAYECVKQWDEPVFDTILLDPPYAYRKSMEFYEGRKASSFLKVKEYIPRILRVGGRVLTFGYQSHSMGKKRGFIVKEVAVFSHGGAIHDTIATLEEFEGLS